jgi:hypothetical protein
MSVQTLLDKIVAVVLAYKPNRKPKRKKGTDKKRIASMVVLVCLLSLAQSVVAIGLMNQEAPSQPPQKSTTRQEKKKPIENHQNTNTTERGSDESPFVIKIVQPEQAQKETTNAESRTQHDGKNWMLSDKIAVAATIFAALQVIALIITIGVQRRYGQRQLRAYMCVSKGHLSIGNTQIIADICIRNSGQTPAYDVKQTIGLLVDEYPTKKTLVVPKMGANHPKTIIGPHDYLTAFGKLDMEPSDEVGTPQATVYVFGEVHYLDAFGKRQWTKYRHIFGGPETLPPVISSGGEAVKVFLRPDTEGNEASQQKRAKSSHS